MLTLTASTFFLRQAIKYVTICKCKCIAGCGGLLQLEGVVAQEFLRSKGSPNDDAPKMKLSRTKHSSTPIPNITSIPNMAMDRLSRLSLMGLRLSSN